MNSTEYVLNAIAWTLGGAAVSSVYWRIYFHRKLVALGAAQKEPPLMIFTAVIVVVVTCMGLLFGEANRIQLDNYVECQSTVNQRNVDTINDRSRSSIAQLSGEIKFYQALADVLAVPPDSGTRTRVLATVQSQIAADRTRLNKIQNNPLQPVTDCVRTKAQ